MSTPRDPWTPPLPNRDPDPGPDPAPMPYGPDEPTIQIRPRPGLGLPDGRADDPTLADVTFPSVPALRPSRPLVPLSPPVQQEPSAPWWRNLRWSPGLVTLLAVCLFVFAFVLLLTAVVLRPILSLVPNVGTGGPLAAATATPSPTATATATPSPTPVAANGATFATLDTSTQGNWQGVYGSAGYLLAGDDTQQLPSGIQVTPASAAVFTWAGSTDDARAPVKPENPGDRIAACWYSPTSFTIDVNITDGQTYRLALYVLDWDQQNRVETVSIADATSGAALDTRPVSGFDNGEYLVWQVRGHVTIQIINAAGSLNAVVSALFFAPTAST